jgi:hypothetical protein
MEQLTQTYVEKKARYYIGSGVVFADDFINKNIGAEKMKELCLFGAYVIRMVDPVPCLFITFGAGGCFVLDYPVAKTMSVSKTEAEQVHLSWFISEADPVGKYNIRSNRYHLDLAHGAIIKRPSDEDIAQLQLNYRDWKTPKKNRTVKHRFSAKSLLNKPKARQEVTPQDRILRELRALDRRRLLEGGIVPPPERAQHMAVLKNGPRRSGWKIKANKLDSYRSDTDEEIEDEGALKENLFGDAESSEEDEEDDPQIRLLKKRKREEESSCDLGSEIAAFKDEDPIEEEEPLETPPKSDSGSEPSPLET